MATNEPIAIVGMGAIFPGASTLREFWANVVNGRDGTGTVPDGRWPMDPAAVFDPAVARPDHVYSMRGGFVGSVPPDPDGLELGPELLERLDPLFHLALHAARRAWSGARTSSVDRARVGVILGHIVLPTETSTEFSRRILASGFATAQGLPDVDEGLSPVDPLNVFPAGLPAKLVAHAFGFGGTAFTLDAACASSFYALALAVAELKSGRADAMLAGGLSRPDPLFTQMGFSQLRALSGRGKPAPFDAEADGLVVGEGSGIVVLKRLSDAIAQGDTIHGLIAGIGLSNDVHGDLLAPSSEGQLRAMRAAYAEAGWSPGEIDLIECHATGTPVGDAVEVESLKKLWEAMPRGNGGCVLGSAKSNFGHTLTAAGSAGLIKVLLALGEETLPPTANFHRPAARLGLENGPFRVLIRHEPWPRRADGLPRRAALSAFGFGGINAHVLIEEWIPRIGERDRRPGPDRGSAGGRSDAPIAVVGMSAHFGPSPGLEEFQAKALAGGPTASRIGDEGIPEFALRLDQFRIPPIELEAILPQQSLMLKVAHEAIADSVWDPGRALRTGVVIGIGLDLNTTNYQLRWTMPERVDRWNRRLELGISDDERKLWTEALRDAAGPALTANRTMGSLGGLVASRISREFHLGGPSFTVSDDETSGNQAILVAVDRLRCGMLDTAVVGAVDFPSDTRISSALAEIAGGSHPRACDGAGALVLKRLDDAVRDGDRIYAVIGETDAITQSRSTARSLEQDPFPAGAATGLASTIRAILSVYRRILPGSPTEDLSAGPRYWAKNRDDSPRGSVVCSTSLGGSRTRIVLEEFTGTPSPRDVAERSRRLGRRDRAIFALEAPDRAGLLDRVESLARLTEEHEGPIEELARRWWNSSGVRGGLRHRIAIVEGDRDGLRSRLSEARDHLTRQAPIPIRKPGERGLLAVSDPSRAEPPRVAFVYPGLGNTFAGMGRDLSALWPEVAHRQEQANARYRDQITRGTFWDRPLPDRFDDHVDLIVGQVAVGSLVTDIIRLHGIRPDAAIGYSMGETSALVSLGAWDDRDELLRRIVESPLFRSELAGESRAARRFWSIPKPQPVDWVAGIVVGPADRVTQAIAGNRSVFPLIVNSPRECVIGGRREAVMKVVGTLGVPFLAIPAVSTVHCPIGSLVESDYRALHHLPTKAVDVPFYSGVWARPYRADRETAAEAITAQAGNPIDFPAVIERAYRDGIRVFLEMGPGGSCSRMIDQILGDRPHLARSACQADRDPFATILNVMAESIAWNVPVDLAMLYSEDSSGQTGSGGGLSRAAGKSPRQIRILVGRRPFPSVKSPKPIPVVKAVQPSVAAVLEPPKAIPPMPNPPEILAPAVDPDPLAQQLFQTHAATASAHEAYLKVASDLASQIGVQIERQISILGGVPLPRIPNEPNSPPPPPAPAPLRNEPNFGPMESRSTEPVALDRRQCLEFAVGSIAAVLGPEFAPIDSHPTRVRLPDEPLMLVDRIMTIEGKVRTLGEGRVVTEHDVLPGGWYLDANRIVPCIAIESGQADLFLSGYLGIDFETKGQAVYRLLDATVTFHRGLPGPGEVIRYDIRITRFFRQGETHLFRFQFEGTVDGEPLLTMKDGCAGFFSPAELAAGKGIVPRPLDSRPRAGIRPDDWADLVPPGSASLDERQVNCLRRGDFAGAFGTPFDRLGSANCLPLPGGRMSLLNRVETLETHGGRFGLGLIRAEADIHPGDWFMVCHFVDDRVMPGTLMYEGCLHTLRVLLMRLGWVGDGSSVAYEPVPGVGSRLRCRGQVIESTRKVTYEVTIKEIGFRPEPFAIADALMYADGRPIVEIADMSLQLTGATRAQLEELWRGSKPASKVPALFDQDKLLEFASGKPSLAFGEPYQPFDERRFIARLPRPPYQFLSRIVRATARPWVLEAGGSAEAEYDVPPDAWYFDADRQDRMPFAVLLEIPLQTCGWMAAYMGSALRSEDSLKFRNLGGTGCQHATVTRNTGTLAISATCTKVSSSAGMILQHYEFSVHGRDGLIYDGKTYFGFFHPDALAEQVGIREAALSVLGPAERSAARAFDLPVDAPFPDRGWRMIDRVSAHIPDGGPAHLGFIEGTTKVDPDAWFFRAHFLQDPVWPGSLGLESLLQLLKVVASARWGFTADTEFEAVALEEPHQWEYRGQVVPTNRLVTVQAVITARDDARRTLRADGLLSVDGKVIYQMKGFTLRLL